MPSGLLPLLIAACLATGLILDGYRERPLWGWKGPREKVFSRETRWVFGVYAMLCAILFIPTVRERAPRALPEAALFGSVFVMLLMALWDSTPRASRLFRGKLRPALHEPTKQELRRERKKLRQRRAQARRNG